MMTVKSDAFDFSHWWCRSARGYGLSCRFTACALGHACYIPQFNNLGLTLDRSDGVYRSVVLIRKRKRIAEDLEAAMEIFGIDYKLAKRLFTPDEPGSPARDIMPKEWADHATKIIENLRRRHKIRRRPRSSPLARKSTRAVLHGLPEILHSPVDGRPGVTPSISVPSDPSVDSELRPSF
jgi:hypothetical protein